MWLIDGFLHIVKAFFVSYEWLLAAVFLTLLFFTKLNPVVLVLMESLLSFQIPHLRPAEYKRSRLSRNRRTVNRAYGGVLSGSAVRERYDTLMVSFFFFFFLKRWRPALSGFGVFIMQNNPSLLGGGAKDCEEGFEDPEVKRKTSFKELDERCMKWSFPT